MIRIITPSYNSTQTIHKTIQSIKDQSINEFKCYIIDDCSIDGSQSYIPELIKDDSRFEIIVNKEKYYPCGNHWKVLQSKEIDNKDICITVDGDDWLPDKDVFKRVLKYYDDNTYCTFGQFKYSKNGKKGFTKSPDFKKDMRKQKWTTSHLRTFKAFLFRLIHKHDLINPEKGSFFEMAGDLAIIYPMLEMAGKNRIKFVNDINYVYNDETPLNEHKVSVVNQKKCEQIIRNKKRYKII